MFIYEPLECIVSELVLFAARKIGVLVFYFLYTSATVISLVVYLLSVPVQLFLLPFYLIFLVLTIPMRLLFFAIKIVFLVGFFLFVSPRVLFEYVASLVKPKPEEVNPRRRRRRDLY